MYGALKTQAFNWIFQLRGPETGAVVLVQRRIFILPTRHGYMFAGVLALMLTGSVNYNLSLGFILTFLLGAMGINGMLYTFRTLANLRVSGSRAPAVFAGEQARFSVCLENPTDADRYSIGLTSDKRTADFVDVPARSTALPTAVVPALQRGMMRPGRLTLFTRYPLGLYYAWSYVNLDMRCIVYPRLAPPDVPLPALTPSPGEGSHHSQGRDDFSGLRAYQSGDSPRHIAWKAMAQERGLLTKQFTGRADAQLWLAWEQVPGRPGIEERLSRLARWVVDAHAAGLTFGLVMPGKKIPPGAGDGHRDRCLEALALFDHDADVPAQLP
jgi:uncharacterized protein (DUF58 family)